MLKYLLSLVLAFSLHTHASEINFVYYVPAGGGLDQATSHLLPKLQEQNIKVNKVFFKTCSEALSFTLNSKQPSYILDYNDQITEDEDFCPKIENIESKLPVVTNLYRTSMFLCTVPNKNTLTYDDIKTSKKFIGVAVEKKAKAVLDVVTADTKSVIIPFAGGAPLKSAIVSGDLDFFLGTSQVVEMMNKGSVCLYSTSKKNTLNLPFIGTKNPNIKEINNDSNFRSNSFINSEINLKLEQALNSMEYQTWLVNSKLFYRK